MVERLGDGWDVGSDFRPRLVKKWLNKPLSWHEPRLVPTGFMGDIACLPQRDVETIMGIIFASPHVHLLLTKDPARLASLLSAPLPDNAWLLATVRNQPDADRVIPALLRVPAGHYGLSMEPLLGPVDILPHIAVNSLSDGSPAPKPCGPRIGWAVVGAESGRGARWGNQYASSDVLAGDAPDAWDVIGWTRSIVAQCRAAGVPCMVKQCVAHLDGKWRVTSDPRHFPPDLVNE